MKNRSSRYQLTQAVLASSIAMASISASAVTTVNTPLVNIATNTTNQGDVEITSTGQLLMNAGSPNKGDALVIDSDTAIVTIDADNTVTCGVYGGTGCAITTIGAGRHGINITSNTNGAGTTATVTVGENSSIITAGNAINVEQTLGLITNSGTLSGNQAGVYFTIDGQGNTLVNTSTGLITNLATSFTPPVYVEGINNIIINDGNIISNVNAPAVLVFDDFNQITNNNLIKSTVAAVQLFASTGAFTNTGTITSAGTAPVLSSFTATTGTFDNSGVIQNTGTSVFASAVSTSASFGTFTNSGTIQAENGHGFSITTSTNGTLNNSGVITTNTSSAGRYAINLEGSATQIINSGTISHTNIVGVGAPINNSANAITVTLGILNEGDITPISITNPAISLAGNSQITLTQNAGTIGGGIGLAGKPSPSIAEVFIMNGGRVSGTIIGQDIQPNILRLNGGFIDEAALVSGIQLGNLGDTVHLAGTTVRFIAGGAGADNYYFTGGDILDFLNGQSGGDTLHVNASFTQNGTISNVPTINVNGASTVFTTKNTITDLNGDLKVNAGQMIVSSQVSGTGATTIAAGANLTIGNSGELAMAPGSMTNKGLLAIEAQEDPVTFPPLLIGPYSQVSGSSYSPQIQSPTVFGSMNVTGAASLANGSTISPSLGTGVYIPEGTVFPILISSGLVTDFATVVQPNSVIISFDKVDQANEIDLIARRKSYSSVATGSANAQAVAQVLDTLTTPTGPADPMLFDLLGQLDLSTSSAALNASLEVLTPPVNYAITEASHVGMDLNFNSIMKRLEDVHGVFSEWTANYRVYRDVDGINYGDPNEVYVGTWIKGYGEGFKQKSIDTFTGYEGDAVGFAIGVDWSVMGNNVVGIAGSATKVHVVASNDAGNLQNATSYQGTLYGLFEPIPQMYVDVLAGIASTGFENRRNIGVGNLTTSAFSSFYGLQTGVQADIGYVYLFDNFYVAPVGRFKFTNLLLDDYSENGAGGLSLAVSNSSVNQTIAGGGVRFASKRQYAQTMYVPEAMIMYLYDFSNEAEQTVANFQGGGTAFATNGVTPGRGIVLFDLGINAHSNDNYICTVKYELEARDHFIGNSLYAELYHRWS